MVIFLKYEVYMTIFLHINKKIWTDGDDNKFILLFYLNILLILKNQFDIVW